MVSRFGLKKIFFILISIGSALSDNTCGDWEPYQNEKCIQITDTLVSYTDAENICAEQNSHLITIDVEEKQIFIENLLKSRDIADYVWIGLEYINNTYKWTDDSVSHYDNWAIGSPKNDTNLCVQIQTDAVEFAKWSDVLCTKKNLVVCEKIQPWSFDQLQSSVMNLVKNIVPIGFIYVQLPKEKSPLEIWPWMEWEDVSSDYAGVFFRAKGGGAASFGSVQEADSPRLTQILSATNKDVKNQAEINITANGKYSTPLDIHGTEHKYEYLQFMVSAAEVRPRNMAVQIWKRIK